MHRKLLNGRRVFKHWNIKSINGLIHFGSMYQYDSSYCSDTNDLIRVDTLVRIEGFTALESYFLDHAELIKLADELEAAQAGATQHCYFEDFDLGFELRFNFTKAGPIVIKGRFRLKRRVSAEIRFAFTVDTECIAETIRELRTVLEALDRPEEPRKPHGA